jgi:transmembrane sensor
MMSNPLEPVDALESFSDIEQQAAHWFLTMQQAHVSAEDKAAFMIWLKEKPEHQSEYFRLRKIWQALPVALEQAQAQLAAKDSATKPGLLTTKKSFFRRWVYGAAACLSLLVMLLQPWSSPLPTEHYYTKAGEMKLFTLSDGSTIKLNTQSKVLVQYSNEQRFINLVKGEAYFVVAKAQNRPFIVKHKDYEFTALGTEFLLRATNAIQLIVTEHSVGVKSNQGKATTVEEGLGLTFAKNWQPMAIETIEHLLAWRQQKLVFSQQPLKQVLAELERYIPGNIHLSDISMAQEPVTGNFNLAQPEEVITTIAEVLGLKIYQSKSGDYFLGSHK